MEEGSFRTLGNPVDHALDNAYFIDDSNEVSATSIDEIDVEKIPLPDAVPSKLDFSKLPPHLMRSATIDSLIRQNEDLMVRLKIQIRRNADLEEQVQNFKDNSSEVFYEIDQLKDELLIYKEKDRLYSHRNQSADEKIKSLTSKIQFLETQYGELYSTARERQQRLAEGERQLKRYQKYRNSVRKVARELRTQVASLTELYTQEKATSKELQIKLGEAADRIQYLNRQNKEDQDHLVQSYESQFNAVKEELNQALEQIESLKKVSIHLESLKDEKIEWNNEKLRLERQMESDREAAGKQIRELQEALMSYRQDSKAKAVQIHNLESDIATSNQSLEALNSEKQALTEQVESLQCLWRDNQNQIEKKEGQIESLQKLNQQLSQQINSLRKENGDLKNKVENQGFKSEERIKELDSQVKVLGRDKVQSENQKKTLGRIENLLAEIQSGFKLKSEDQANSSSVSKDEAEA